MLAPHLKTLWPGPAPVIHHLGPYSALWAPNYWRRTLAGLHPAWYVVDYTLNPGQSTKLSVNLPPGSWVVGFTASFTGTASFRFQLFDPMNDAPLSLRPYDTRNGAGTGRHPYVLARPLFIEETTPLLIKVANQDLINAQTGQLALETYFNVTG